jgi:hypothetical protein
MMVLKVKERITVENLRKHSRSEVEKLRELLAAGVQVRPDPRHPNFYEVENDGGVYYINLRPHTGKVMLLAIWRQRCVEAT